MTSIFQSQHIDKDFISFQKALALTNEFKFKITEQNKPTFKKYHRLTYVIALFESKVENEWREDNKFLFLNEILSDLLSNSSLCLIGFYHSSQIIIRRLLENFYNHIYYFDHPVEFALLNLGRNDYTPIIDLKNYLESHPLIKSSNDKNIKVFNNQLFQHYHELCRTAHTKGEGFMGLAKNLEEIKPEFELTSHIDLINKSLQSIVYLLYKFHRDLIFTHIETDIISKSFQKSLRGELLS